MIQIGSRSCEDKCEKGAHSDVPSRGWSRWCPESRCSHRNSQGILLDPGIQNHNFSMQQLSYIVSDGNVHRRAALVYSGRTINYHIPPTGPQPSSKRLHGKHLSYLLNWHSNTSRALRRRTPYFTTMLEPTLPLLAI